MRSVEKSAKTLEEAISLALLELGLPGRGSYNPGFGRAWQAFVWHFRCSGKPGYGLRKRNKSLLPLLFSGRSPSVPAELTEKENVETKNTVSSAEDKIACFLKEATALMGIEVYIEKKEEEETIRYELSGPHMGSVIGRRGDTLDALQYLANIIANKEKTEPRKRILLDAENYRKRREETLIRLAHRLAGRVKRTGHKVVLEPMSPMERRVIHTALQNDPEVKTSSEGEEPYRRLVIFPAEGTGSRYSRGAAMSITIMDMQSAAIVIALFKEKKKRMKIKGKNKKQKKDRGGVSAPICMRMGYAGI